MNMRQYWLSFLLSGTPCTSHQGYMLSVRTYLCMYVLYVYLVCMYVYMYVCMYVLYVHMYDISICMCTVYICHYTSMHLCTICTVGMQVCKLSYQLSIRLYSIYTLCLYVCLRNSLNFHFFAGIIHLGEMKRIAGSNY